RHKAHRRLEAGQRRKRRGVERRELARERGRVRGGAAKDHAASGVGADRFLDLMWQLREVLVRDRERKAKPTGLREGVRKGPADTEEALELIDVELKIRPALLVERLARERSLPNPRDEEAPRKRRGALTPAARAEISEENAAAVDEGAYIDRRARLTEQPSQARAQQEVTHLV